METMIKVYSIFDSKAEEYGPMFFQRNKHEATRTFGELVVDPSNRISRHPGDYTLFELGTFDRSKGLYVPHKAHENLGVGSEYVKDKSKLN